MPIVQYRNPASQITAQACSVMNHPVAHAEIVVAVSSG